MAGVYVEDPREVEQRRKERPLGDPRAWQYVPLSGLAGLVAAGALISGLLPGALVALLFAVAFAWYYKELRPRDGDLLPFSINEEGIGGPRFPGGFVRHEEVDRVVSRRDNRGDGGFGIYLRSGGSVTVPASWLTDPGAYWAALQAHVRSISGPPWP